MAKKGTHLTDWLGGKRQYYSNIAKAVYREHNVNIVCEKCGSLNDICIHHKNRNHKDSNITNLQALCRPCHISIHKCKNSDIYFIKEVSLEELIEKAKLGFYNKKQIQFFVKTYYENKE